MIEHKRDKSLKQLKIKGTLQWLKKLLSTHLTLADSAKWSKKFLQ